MNMPYDVLLIPFGYLLGAIPSAYLVTRLLANVSILGEGDGHISATAAYRKAGRTAFLITIIMDVGKGYLAIFLSSLITSIDWIILAAGMAAIIGHCWSVFIKFKGGLGATVIYGVLVGISIWFFLIASMVSLIFFVITRRSTFATILLVAAMSVTLIIVKASWMQVLFPFSLLLVQLIKRFQIKKTAASSEYKSDFLSDLKRKN